MKLTISLDLLEEAFYYVSPTKPVSAVPLVYLTLAVEKAQIAYTTDNEAKLARKIERSFKAAFHEILQANQVYRSELDQDKLLTPQDHLKKQGQVVDSIVAAIKKYPELSLIRVELAGSWPLYQTQEGHLDLTE
ncbi:hypothetical protein [Enterococcus hermanniensis]|uniref:Uncharacterized protein n=1 Tax=Enterococcus hermanniensis TaxID=249189 RepID=A0A1L8TKS0_9ENTE|nr:hypothetical protein [Enterococcus hermanniensis]OJG44921.1 hypothetical protein RV04_GL000489 [Enterococcus hermanniensis]